MRTFDIHITGRSPYMQHRMDDKKLAEWEKQRGMVIENFDVNNTDQVQALYHSYIDDGGKFYIPSEHFKQSFLNGGGFVKGKVGNSTKTMKNIVAGMWRITPEQIPFCPFDTVDVRSAVNKNVHARVMVRRPKWSAWDVGFQLTIDDDFRNGITLETIKAIIDYAGRYIGVGSYRPQHSGEFGRYELTSIMENVVGLKQAV